MIRDRRAPLNLRNSRHVATLATPPAAGVAWSPLRLFVLLIGSECLAIIACSVLLAVIGPAGQETGLYAEAAIAGLGVAVLFALIRPMIRFSTASPKGTAIIAISVPGTLAALALAQLGALGGYAYLAHYFGTTIPPVSFHNWLRAWALSTSIVGLLDFGAGRLSAKWLREGRLAKRIVVYGGGEHASRFLSEVGLAAAGRNAGLRLFRRPQRRSRGPRSSACAGWETATGSPIMCGRRRSMRSSSRSPGPPISASSRSCAGFAICRSRSAWRPK